MKTSTAILSVSSDVVTQSAPVTLTQRSGDKGVRVTRIVRAGPMVTHAVRH